MPLGSQTSMSSVNITTSSDLLRDNDETNHYSDCSENSTVPLECTPKHSTRALIQFWNTPHESGTTVSFTFNDKDSTETDNVDKSGGHVHDSSNSLLSVSENCSTRRQNSSLGKDSMETDNFNISDDSTRDCNTSQRSSAESINALRHKATLLEVSMDEDRNDEGEKSMNSLDISISSHPSHNNIEIGLCPMVNLTGKLVTTNDVDIDVSPMEQLKGERLLTSPCEEPVLVPLVEQEESKLADVIVSIENGSHCGVSNSKFPKGLPPLAPSPRRSCKRMYETQTSSMSRECPPQVLPVEKAFTPDATEVSTSECSSNVSKEEEDLQTEQIVIMAEGFSTRTVIPFTSESQVPPDDDLDLTSIHSEDSDEGIPCNTRDHMIDVDSHVLLHDIQFDEKSTSTNDKNDSLGENRDNESSREHNQSNDTERMILNVMDAAEKAMLVSGNGQAECQLEPSRFFDCAEYGPEYIQFEPASQFDPMSPTQVTEEDVVERETPLRSNSCRTDSVAGISNLVDVMASSKSAPRRRLLPKGNTTKALSKIEKKAKPKNRKVQGSVNHVPLISSPGEVDDEDLENSSVSTLDIDSDKEADTSDLFWIDAFLDFVSPLEDSRSLDSDSSTSSASESHGVHLLNTGASVVTDLTSSKKALRQKKKTQTSLSRLREWWQKELVSEVMRGNLVHPSPDADNESDDHPVTGSYESVEKIVSHEFHKVLSGKKVALLGSGINDANRKEKSTYTQPQDWLELFVATLESAKNGSLGCGVVETVAEAYGTTQKDTTSTGPENAPLDMSFDSLDGLVQKLKKEKNGSSSNGLSDKFQTLYDQLQQKLEDANLFDLGVDKTPSSKANVALKDALERGSETDLVVEGLPDDSLKYLLNPNPTLGGITECKAIPGSEEVRGPPIYSSPPVDGDFQTSLLSPKASGISPRFAIKSFARAKEALALRRKASSLRNTEPELYEIRSTSTEMSAFEYDFSLESPFSPTQNLDNRRVSVDNNESSFPRPIVGSDDPAQCDFCNDNNFDTSYFQKEFIFSESQFNDTDDKNNITKETATDHSCTEESLAIKSALENGNGQYKDIEISGTSLSANNSGDGSKLFKHGGHAAITESFGDVSIERSGMTRNYNPLDDSETDLSDFFRENSCPLGVKIDDFKFGENVYEELLSGAEGLPSTASTSGIKTPSRMGHRSYVTKKGTLAKLGNLSTAINRTGLKSKTRHHAEWLSTPASRPISLSVSSHKSVHMPFYNQEEKKEDTGRSDPPETVDAGALGQRPKSSINDTPFLSSFRQKARRIRRQRLQGKHISEEQTPMKSPEGNLLDAGKIFSLSEQLSSDEWEDFTSSGPFSVWTK